MRVIYTFYSFFLNKEDEKKNNNDKTINSILYTRNVVAASSILWDFLPSVTLRMSSSGQMWNDVSSSLSSLSS